MFLLKGATVSLQTLLSADVCFKINPSFLLSLAITDFNLGTLTVCGNLLLRTPATYFIANLALSDFPMGLLISYSLFVLNGSQYQYLV